MIASRSLDRQPPALAPLVARPRPRSRTWQLPRYQRGPFNRLGRRGWSEAQESNLARPLIRRVACNRLPLASGAPYILPRRQRGRWHSVWLPRLVAISRHFFQGTSRHCWPGLTSVHLPHHRHRRVPLWRR